MRRKTVATSLANLGLIGSGKNELATRVGHIIERTMTPLIENIRRRDTPADSTGASATAGVGATTNGGGSNHGVNDGAMETAKGRSSPHDQMEGMVQSEGAAMKSDDAMANPFMTAVQQAAAAAATNATASTHTPLQTPPPHAAEQLTPAEATPAWRPGPGLNPWEDWQTGIAGFDHDGQDRFMANSLVALGLGGNDMATTAGGVESDWPLLLFPSAAANQGPGADVQHDPGDGMGGA